MPGKMVKLTESTVEQIQTARAKIKELLGLSELPSENLAFSALLHAGLDVLNATDKESHRVAFDNTRFLSQLAVWHQKSLQAQATNGDNGNGETNTTTTGD